MSSENFGIQKYKRCYNIFQNEKYDYFKPENLLLFKCVKVCFPVVISLVTIAIKFFQETAQFRVKCCCSKSPVYKYQGFNFFLTVQVHNTVNSPFAVVSLKWNYCWTRSPYYLVKICEECKCKCRWRLVDRKELQQIRALITTQESFLAKEKHLTFFCLGWKLCDTLSCTDF